MRSNQNENKETTNKIFRHLPKHLNARFKRIIHHNKLLGTKVLEWKPEEEGKYKPQNKFICLYYPQLNQTTLKKKKMMNIGSRKWREN